MILFFYGEDTFRLRQKIKQLKEKFVTSSLGDINLVVLEGKTATFDEIVRQILAMPFLSRKRLVIIENLLKEGKKSAQGRDLAKGGGVQEKAVDFLKKIPDSTVLAFVEEGVPDRRTALFRRLNVPRKAQEFKLLEGEALRRWVRKEVESRGGTIEPPAITKLIEYVGSDLWRMNNELDKLTAYSLSASARLGRDGQVKAENIELLVQSQVQANIFSLIEATAERKPSKAMNELYKLFHEGASEVYIMTMIIYEYRNLLIVKDAQERSTSAGLHPYVLSKITPVARQYKLEELKKIYGKLLNFESAIKIGKIEPRLALELLVFQLTR